MYGIGTVARLAQVSLRTLRYYDEIGLLRPVWVDPDTGYRWYAADQLHRLHRILALRDLGVRLAEIATLLDGDLGVDELRGMLLLRRAEAHERVADETDRLARVEARLHNMEETTMSTYDVIVKRVEPEWVIAATEEVPDVRDIGHAQGRLWPRLHAALDAAGVEFKPPSIAMEQGADPILLTASLVVGEDVHVEGDGIVTMQLPGVERVAATVIHGDPNYNEGFDALKAWAQKPAKRRAESCGRCTSTVTARATPGSWNSRSAFCEDDRMGGLNIADIFETVVATVPDHPALVVRSSAARDEVRFTFAELDARVNRLANALVALGIGEGDHVGCHLYDGNQYVEVTLAAYKVRAVPVNVNFRYVDEELTYLFGNADLKVVLTEPDLEDRAARAAATLAWPCPVVVADERYETLLADQPDAAPDVGERSPDDRYGLWTGGTTGMPKGVMWRQEDIYLSAIGGGGNALLGVAPVTDLDDVAARARTGSPLPGTLTLCPLMHGGGFWLAFSAILEGSFSVLIRDVGFDPAFALRVIGEERVSLLMTIGDAYARPIVDVLESSGEDEYDLSSLLVYGSGGAILSPSVREDLARLLPRTFVHDGFGASETGGQGRLTGTGADGAPRFEMDASNVVIADDGTLCRPGDGRVGMLATSGHIPLGYYKDAAKTAATFPVIDGVRYAVPGDLASVDADGSIVVYGRGSVSINSGGEKIFPEEVEKALKSHPAVFDATVVGTPNERFGAQVTAVVELRPEHVANPPDLLELQEHCRQYLAGFKVPRAVVFVDATVRSPSGKPDYRWAKETALAALAPAAENA